MWFKKNKWKIIIPLLIILLLASAFLADNREMQKTDVGDTNTVEVSGESLLDVSASPKQTPDTSKNPTTPSSEGSGYVVSPVPSRTPKVSEAPADSEEKTQLTCTISVSCAVLLDNVDLLSEEKRELVPQSGWLLAPTTVAFSECESVFDVLKRTLAGYGIHMEFVDTPAYNSAYIEGIGNLYEFDAGSLSGWMYRVNGTFPNYGCSRYILQRGDVIEWLYTCDLGADIGGDNDFILS
ncbi:MAG: DUF4430 domain-containing protein [Clostridia bacterium]|nr:DUF4430 domain-containing protein [Clostridia bacterium]